MKVVVAITPRHSVAPLVLAMQGGWQTLPGREIMRLGFPLLALVLAAGGAAFASAMT